MNLLAVDIGNTNITLGIFENDTLKAIYRLTTAQKRTTDEYGLLILQFLRQELMEATTINDVIISSVVPQVMHTFINAIKRYLHHDPLLVEPGIKTGISIRIENPKELGADRLVLAAGTRVVYARDALVIDFGTATTFDIVTAKGEYRGGSIAPGLVITSEALSTRTAKLPEVGIVAVQNPIATNTIDAMQSGLFFGYLGLVKEIILAIKQSYGSELFVVATGGLGHFITEHCDLIEVYDPTLIFSGLYEIYDRNRGSR